MIGLLQSGTGSGNGISSPIQPGMVASEWPPTDLEGDAPRTVVARAPARAGRPWSAPDEIPNSGTPADSAECAPLPARPWAPEAASALRCASVLPTRDDRGWLASRVGTGGGLAAKGVNEPSPLGTDAAVTAVVGIGTGGLLGSVELTSTVGAAGGGVVATGGGFPP